MSFTPDSKAVAVGMENGVVVLLDTASGRELMRLNGHEAQTGNRFQPGGRRIATGSGDRTARVWDATTGNSICTFEGHAGGVAAVAFSAEGGRVATGSEDRSAKLWDVESGKVLFMMSGHTAAGRNIAFLTGRAQCVRLATASDDCTARLWDVKTGKEERTLRGHASRVQDIAVHPQHKGILTTGADRTVRTHPSTDDDLIGLARLQVTRALTGDECEKYAIVSAGCEVSKLAAEGRKRWNERNFKER